MKSEIKTLWLEALRSNQYKQGTYALNRIEDDGSSTYCCLGVLCEIAHTYGVISKRPNGEDMLFLYDNDDEVLPEEVVTWAHLYDCNPDCKYKGETTTLAALNDECGLNFAEIADTIEEQF